MKKKAKTILTIAGSLEYRELAKRHEENIFGPFTEDEENNFLKEAEEILKILNL